MYRLVCMYVRLERQHIRASATRRLCTMCWLEHEECHSWHRQATFSRKVLCCRPSLHESSLVWFCSICQGRTPGTVWVDRKTLDWRHLVVIGAVSHFWQVSETDKDRFKRQLFLSNVARIIIVVVVIVDIIYIVQIQSPSNVLSRQLASSQWNRSVFRHVIKTCQKNPASSAATILQPLYRTTCICLHPQLGTGGFWLSRVLLATCPCW